MAVLNFPDTTGQATDGSFQYTGDNGVVYSWDGEKWEANADNSLIADLQEVTDNGNETTNTIEVWSEGSAFQGKRSDGTKYFEVQKPNFSLTLGTTNQITLQGDSGNSTFAGHVQVGGAASSTVTGVRLFPEGYLYLSREDGSTPFQRGYRTDTNAESYNILASGAANFASTVTAGYTANTGTGLSANNNSASNATINAQNKNNTGNVFEGRDNTGGAGILTSSIGATGNFRLGLNPANSSNNENGLFLAGTIGRQTLYKKNDNTNPFFTCIKNNGAGAGVTLVDIAADGGATFTSRVNVGASDLDDRGVSAYNTSDTVGTISASNYDTGGILFQGYNASVSDTQAVIEIRSDGSVRTGGTPNNPKIILNGSDGSGTFAGGVGFGTGQLTPNNSWPVHITGNTNGAANWGEVRITSDAQTQPSISINQWNGVDRYVKRVGINSDGTAELTGRLSIKDTSQPWIEVGYGTPGTADHRIQWDSAKLTINADVANAVDNSGIIFNIDQAPVLTIDKNGGAQFPKGSIASGDFNTGTYTIMDNSGIFSSYKAAGTADATTAYQVVRDGTIQYQVRADGEIQIGGTLPSAPKIKLQADGSATFAGDITANNVTFSLTDGSTLNVKDRLINLLARVDAIESGEVSDDANHSALLTLVSNLLQRVSALEGGTN